MSWKDNYKRDLIITCGDGETFTCYTLPSFSKEIEFNTMEFNFLDIDIPLIKKTTISGVTIPLEFFFINDDHIDQTNSFLFSASDPGPWTISHPYYDTILAQVSSIKIDDTDGNVTRITCNARQTLDDRNPNQNLRSTAVDIVLLQQANINALILSVPDINPTLTDINSIKKVTDKNYKNSVKIIISPFDSEAYFNAFNVANSYVNTFTATPIAAINAITSVISLPSQFSSNVKDRIRVLKDSMSNLRSTIIGLATVTAKKIFVIQSASTMAAMCAAAVTPAQGNYTRASNANDISDIILSVYKTFMADVDALQGDNGGNPLSFIPEFDVIRPLGILVNVTVSSLFDIALAGRKEYFFVLTDDSDYLLLTHKFSGLDPQDTNINEFIDNNIFNWRDVVLGTQKGKTVTYYA